MRPLQVLQQYAEEYQPQQISVLRDEGGLSGARIWRIQAALGEFGLRCWPVEHPSAERLRWIHAVLSHVRNCGFELVPTPIAARDGRTFVLHEGRLWELAPWMPGLAVETGKASEEQVSAAFAALALFHKAAATFADVSPRSGAAPAVAQRLERIETWLHGGGVEQMERAAATCSPPQREYAPQFLSAFRRFAPLLETELRELLATPVALQPCIRDIHDQHVLMIGNRVTGLIDFGAMRVDSVATDVARLLGTMAGDDASLREAGLSAYQLCRRLSDIESRLVVAIVRANVVLTGPQWLQWLLVEQKSFESMPAVLARLERIWQRLQKLA
ncbi:MAG: phosphotransferase [Planctomycetes bacterium]|nr:phosphotransferase [Planctomycetota bacterium]